MIIKSKPKSLLTRYMFNRLRGFAVFLLLFSVLVNCIEDSSHIHKSSSSDLVCVTCLATAIDDDVLLYGSANNNVIKQRTHIFTADKINFFIQHFFNRQARDPPFSS